LYFQRLTTPLALPKYAEVIEDSSSCGLGCGLENRAVTPNVVFVEQSSIITYMISRRLGSRLSEAQAWNRRMNRDHVVINWKFTRKKARQKFSYKRNKFRLSET
jgi:hypothetical protein